jgi:hypothetical protein
MLSGLPDSRRQFQNQDQDRAELILASIWHRVPWDSSSEGGGGAFGVSRHATAAQLFARAGSLPHFNKLTQCPKSISGSRQEHDLQAVPLTGMSLNAADSWL